jgi:hypothetical protein
MMRNTAHPAGGAKVCSAGHRANCVDSAARDDGSCKRRYRCPQCGERWATIEYRVGRSICKSSLRALADQLAPQLPDSALILRLRSLILEFTTRGPK